MQNAMHVSTFVGILMMSIFFKLALITLAIGIVIDIISLIINFFNFKNVENIKDTGEITETIKMTSDKYKNYCLVIVYISEENTTCSIHVNNNLFDKYTKGDKIDVWYKKGKITKTIRLESIGLPI